METSVAARVKGDVYMTVERPGVMSGLERAALFKRQEAGLEVAELKVLRCSLRVTSVETSISEI